jgi:hypothetical protein
VEKWKSRLIQAGVRTVQIAMGAAVLYWALA